MGGLGPRLRRHARLDKRHHWHVDALRDASSLVAVATRRGSERLECAVAEQLSVRSGANRPVRRFGASDCRCAGHLIRFDRRPDLGLDGAWTVTTLDAVNRGRTPESRSRCG
jgi:Uri superfamily endonuclease